MLETITSDPMTPVTEALLDAVDNGLLDETGTGTTVMVEMTTKVEAAPADEDAAEVSTDAPEAVEIVVPGALDTDADDDDDDNDDDDDADVADEADATDDADAIDDV